MLLWLKKYKYLLFLLILIVLLFSTRFFSLFMEFNAAKIATILLLIIAGFILLPGTRHIHNLIKWFAIATLLYNGIYYFYPTSKFLSITSFLLLFIYLLLIVYLLFNQILKVKSISLSQIIAAFSAYIIIGYVGSFVSSLIILFDPEAFNILNPSPGSNINEELVYFSFITMTTIGYGDIVPVSFFAKRLTLLLGLSSQFYLTVVIAIFIGKYLNNK